MTISQRLTGLALLLLVAEGCAARRPPTATTGPLRDKQLTFVATAYCHGNTTAAGVRVHPGVVAADPSVLPLGTVVRIERTGRHDGTYTVLDTGADIHGRRVDLFIRDCREAVKFGRREVRVVVVRAATEGR